MDRAMTITHSTLQNEFISFWFETFVDGELRYETHLDLLRGEWHLCPAGAEQCVLHGKISKYQTQKEELDAINQLKPIIEEAIIRGFSAT